MPRSTHLAAAAGGSGPRDHRPERTTKRRRLSCRHRIAYNATLDVKGLDVNQGFAAIVRRWNCVTQVPLGDIGPLDTGTLKKYVELLVNKRDRCGVTAGGFPPGHGRCRRAGEFASCKPRMRLTIFCVLGPLR